MAACCRTIAQQWLGAQRIEGRDVGPGAEHALGAGDDDRAHGIVVAQLHKLRTQPSNTARFKLFFARGRLMVKVAMAPSRLTSTSLASLMVAPLIQAAR
ncbi:hypothetical protein [Cupriavidus basilensis]|uniref:hypothetical protein n=1 Tax=Cupriavidus basilensis TaxID=68895 RepID=UPI003A5996C9